MEERADRKKKRFAARLKSTRGIICSDEPQLNIVICNAGQATGLNKNMILRLIEECCLQVTFKKFVAEKGESHSYLVFNDIKNSTEFYEKFNGKAKFEENGKPIYMSYVASVPDIETVCENEYPHGLIILENFITPEEEKTFLKLFDWKDDIHASKLKNRQVKHYGYEFRYGTNDVDLSSPLLENIPEACNMLWEKLRSKGIVFDKFDQLTVNKYYPGQGIPSHVDKHSPFGSTIASLSLGSSIIMDWKHHSGSYVPVVVNSRSMLIMQDAARYDWQHGIQSRTWDPVIEARTVHTGNTQKQVQVITTDTVDRGTRVSLTFRSTRSGQCNCVYKTLCDKVEKDSPSDIEDKLAADLEELHVHQVYEQIAGHFSSTRHKPWPKVVEFMQRVTPGDIVIDLGSGNGKNILERNDIMQIACERSGALLAECRARGAGAGPGVRGVRGVRGVPGVRGARGAECVRTDALQCAVGDSRADLVLCVAVVHHFSTHARRKQAISTIVRLLRPGGQALITVWAKDQAKSNYLKTKQPLPSNEVQTTVGGINLPVHENRTQFQHKDLLVPWKLRKTNQSKHANEADSTLLRYYHVFEEHELEDLCKRPDVRIENSFYEEGNWCVIINKI